MNRTFQYIISDKDNGKEILAFLKQNGYSRHILSAMKKNKEAISLNGERGFGHTILKTNDQLIIHLLETETSENIIPAKMDLDILYEDEDILVLNKAAFTPIHPSQGNYENTLANAVAYYYKEKGENFVYRCINRLDRDTTGVLVLAKNALSGAILSMKMKQRKIHRTYVALAEGITPKQGIIDAPIARVDGSTIEREVNYETGEPAVTHFSRLAHNDDFSFISLKLETGRTHQIRVHMKHLGYPLPGDFLYNPSFDKIMRQALHSWKLEFMHPITKEPMSFQAPIPDDFINAFNDSSHILQEVLSKVDLHQE